jgi:hypothetical protein
MAEPIDQGLASRYRRWETCDLLGPTTIDAAEGHCAVRAGRHQVQFVMGGLRPNVITVEIALYDCRAAMRP